MKASRKAFFCAILVSLMFVVSANNIYAADCPSATITRIGNNPTISITGATSYVVQLDCSNDAVWTGIKSFYLSDDLGDAGLATALTAFSLDKPLWVRVLGVVDGSIVSMLFVNQ